MWESTSGDPFPLPRGKIASHTQSHRNCVGAEEEGTNANTRKTCCYSWSNACMANWHRFTVHITTFSVSHTVPLPRIMWFYKSFVL